MNEAARDLCYQHYRSETDPAHRMKYLGILIEALKGEMAELEKYVAGVSVPNTKRGSK